MKLITLTVDQLNVLEPDTFAVVTTLGDDMLVRSGLDLIQQMVANQVIDEVVNNLPDAPPPLLCAALDKHLEEEGSTGNTQAFLVVQDGKICQALLIFP